MVTYYGNLWSCSCLTAGRRPARFYEPRLNEKRRAGFTLIELLVVIALIGVLAGLIVAFLPSFNTRSRAARGAQNLQTWLNSARQQAIRDQAPRGLRILFWTAIAPSPFGATEAGNTVTITTTTDHGFIPGELLAIAGVGVGAYNGIYTITSTPTSTTFTYTNGIAGLPPSGGGGATTGKARKCQFLEQPDDLGGGRYYDTVSGTYKTLELVPHTLSPADPLIQPQQVVRVDGADFADGTVQPGDYLEIMGTGLAHRIREIRNSGPPLNRWDVLILDSPGLPSPLSASVREFRITRQPRIAGDEVFDLPDTVVVDASTNAFYGNVVEQLFSGSGLECDVLFSPTGAVIPRGRASPYIAFWVRSTDEDILFAPTDPARYFRNEPSLIVVYLNSGLVAAYPVDSGNPANPYGLVRP